MLSKNNKIQVAFGDNFSGRSEYLRKQTTNGSNSIYIGEIPGNYLSGVCPTVQDEIALFSSLSSPDVEKLVDGLKNELEFNELLSNNPFELSGGEQVLLAIISGILLEPSLIALDTLVEQLNKEWTDPLLELMQNPVIKTSFLLSDNRINEYGIYFSQVPLIQANSEFQHSFSLPKLVELRNGTPSYQIELNDLFFSYSKKKLILKGINLKLEPGKILFLQGRNGAGKSTLAKVLAGILKQKQGKVLVNNKIFDPYRTPGSLFGYSFQNPDEQLFSGTVFEEVLRTKRREESSYSERREAFLSMFGLEHVRNVHPAELPFVMRKRLALASTLATERPWYIIDEPTIGQDDSFVAFLASLFQNLANNGKGLIIISHSQAFLNRLDPKVLYLEDGMVTTT